MVADTTRHDGARSAMAYNGGKAGSGTVQRLINLMPPHRRYIEPFLGAGAVLRAKRPAPDGNLGIEIDPAVLAAHWGDADAGASAAADPGATAGAGEGPRCSSTDEAGEAFTVICGDGLQHLRERRYGTGTLIYCDPPYLRETRTSSRNLYRYELTEAEHRALLAALREQAEAGALVMLSGYHSKLYARELRGWHLTTFGSMTRRGMALEHLWMSFPPPLTLHDYRYLGEDYRERERIRKKVRRWTAKLRDMPRLERQALLAALAEVDADADDGADADRDRRAAA
jgi:DNA adenine methylase